ncbi:MAG: iron-containing alcohol dehydrogenase [Bacteroides sp.]|nr:iron-containing alcohol dehydrogenase [Bacteroides sp.]MCM1379894.1 iron-containing alcohol dehydrogenase [Bacteroides sp.]MCM1446252.1 iron-containing alcohol dehydrogenase [Prevotella sp.]
MTSFDYCTPTEYVFGRNTESRVGELSAAKLGRKVLLCYGGGSAVRSGLLGRVEASLRDASVEYIEFGGIKPNPTDDRVYEGIEICRKNGVDALLAVGGGSVIDTAKAIAGGVPYAGDFWDFWAGNAVMTEALPVGTVLTIAAAGSEGSGNSVITKIDGGKKVSLRTNVLRPKFSILNPELTMTLPKYQTACGIVDMMAHIMERYFSNTPDCEVTDRLCEGTLKAIVDTAPRVMAAPNDYQARANIMWAGTIAHNGICGVGREEDWTSHGMEHELSALYGVAHGAGLSVVFPAWLEYVAQFNSDKIEQFGRRVFGVRSSAEAITALRTFNRAIGMPITLAELGITDPDIPLLVKKLHETKGALIGNFCPADAAASEKIYRLML